MVTTRENILQAAFELALDGGLPALRVDAVVRKAGCNKRMVYHYFGSKTGLVDELLRQQLGVALAGMSESSGKVLANLMAGYESAAPDGSGDVADAVRVILPVLVEQAAHVVVGAAEWRQFSEELMMLIFKRVEVSEDSLPTAENDKPTVRLRATVRD